MSVAAVSYIVSLSPDGPPPAIFAEPDWRGDPDDPSQEVALRPLCRIERQIDRLSGWIAAGEGYGWLGAYQARRAGFELRSIGAHMTHEIARNGGRLADHDRRAIQSRLDRLELCLNAARSGAGIG
jgi:hypothetical protein